MASNDCNLNLDVGYYIPTKKLKVLHIDEWAVEAVKHPNIKSCSLIDLEKDLASQGNFDAILTKLTGLLVKHDDSKAQRKLQRVKDYIIANPKTAQVDPISSQKKTIARDEMEAIFAHLVTKSFDFVLIPKTVIVTKSGDYMSQLPKDFTFPAICKTLQASGGMAAHEMGIIWRAEQLEKFEKPILCQEYVDHDATIFKVYVLGEESNIITRVSFPNFTDDTTLSDKPIMFNSQDWKHELPAHLQTKIAGKAAEPSMEQVTKISNALSEGLGLTIFGYDLITCAKTKKHAIIDINYFPDFSKVPNFHKKLTQLIVDVYKAKNNK
mmetsp:Transcript_25422/g.28280  ORF Transcript_25422/g.28280 Transcript_25422/m.28280 type:complete len:324 (-) Transcript_25422:24-995(-)